MAAILDQIRGAGITLSADGGSLIATPKTALTDELRSLIRANKADLLAELAAPAPGARSRWNDLDPAAPYSDSSVARFQAAARRKALAGHHLDGYGPGALKDTKMAQQVRAMERTGAPGISPEFAARLSAEDRADLAAGDLAVATVAAFAEAAVAREAEDLREHFMERAGTIEHDAGLPRPEAELEAARLTATFARNRRYLWSSLRQALAEYPELADQVPDRPGKVDALPLGLPTTPCSGAGAWCGRATSTGRRR
jgi:TubC N-terminal docking domain